MPEIPGEDSAPTFDNQPDLTKEAGGAEGLNDRDIEAPVLEMKQTAAELLGIDQDGSGGGPFRYGEFIASIVMGPARSPVSFMSIEFHAPNRDESTLYRIEETITGGYLMFKGHPMGEKANKDRVYRAEAEMVAGMMKEFQPFSRAADGEAQSDDPA